MRTTMAITSRDNPSSSKRNFKWMMGEGSVGGGSGRRKRWEERVEKEIPPFSTSSSRAETATAAAKKKTSAAAVAVSRLRSVMTAALTSSSSGRQNRSSARMTGTLYGNRCGHVHLAFQADSRARPVVLLELATPTSALVREMASGLVRIALECEREAAAGGKDQAKRLMEESPWRAYCNGRKCGYALRRECGPADWKVLKAVEPVSMGAGVLPADSGGDGPDGEMMYMRATFERVTGSKDSEAFYMMSPGSSSGGTELSIYFLRV